MGLFDALLLAAVMSNFDIFASAVPQARSDQTSITTEVPPSPPPPPVSVVTSYPTLSGQNGSMSLQWPHTEHSGQTLDGPSWPTTSSTIYSTIAASAHTEISAITLDTPTSSTLITTSFVVPSPILEHSASSLDVPTLTSLTLVASPVLAISETSLDTPRTTETAGASRARLETTATALDVPNTTTVVGEDGSSIVVVALTNTPNSGGEVTASPRLEVTAVGLDGPEPESTATTTGEVEIDSSEASIVVAPYQTLNGGLISPVITVAPSPGSPDQPLLVGSVAITPGRFAQTIDGIAYSLAPSGDIVYVNGSPTPATAIRQTYQPAVFVAGTPILPGSVAQIISGATYSLAYSASTLFINSSPTPVSAILQQQISPTAVYVANTPVLPGSSARVIAGTTYSLASGGSVLYANGVASTLTMPPVSPEETGLVAAILSGIAGGQLSQVNQALGVTSTTATIGAGGSGNLERPTAESTPLQTSGPQVQTVDGGAGILESSSLAAVFGVFAGFFLWFSGGLPLLT